MRNKRQCRGTSPFSFLGLIVALCAAIPCRAHAGAQLDFPPSNFTIYDSEGKQVVGHSRYALEYPRGGEVVIHGENRYLDSEYDIENDILRVGPDGDVPSLLTFSHTFYNSNGSTKVLGSADTATGQVVCVADESGRQRRLTAQFDFPPDTYAGAALLVPIEHALRQHIAGPVRMHVFDCAPEPRIVALEVTVSAPDNRWRFYPGQLVLANVKPDFGFWDFLVAPFVPKVHAWFDPSERFHYVGGQIHRYLYGSDHIILAKARTSDETAAGHVGKPEKAVVPIGPVSIAHDGSADSSLRP